MSIKILGVITEDKVEKVKVNKHIDELSNKLYDSNIPHLIIEDDKDGIGIMLIKCVPSVLIHNDEDRQWEYSDRYMEDGAEDSTLFRKYILEDSNKKIDILNFLKTILKAYED